LQYLLLAASNLLFSFHLALAGLGAERQEIITGFEQNSIQCDHFEKREKNIIIVSRVSRIYYQSLRVTPVTSIMFCQNI
jgi:hypothetical protein